MSQYVVIENSEITERYDSIPQNWRNISGFYLMSDNERAAHGFVPVKQSDIIFDPLRHRLISNDVKLDSTGNPYVDRVVEEIITEEEYQTYKINEAISILRNKRDALLSSSDWTMTSDLMELKGAVWTNSWKEYRQTLRGITESYKNSQNLFDPDSVVFPTQPEK